MRRSRGKKHRRGGKRSVRHHKGRRGGGRFRGSRRISGGGGRKRFTAAIRKIRKLSPGLQVQAMRAANDKFIRCMCSAVKRLKNKKLPAKVTVGFRRNAKRIRKLVNPKTNMKVKRSMLTRSGGFLPLLLAGLGGSLIGNLLHG